MALFELNSGKLQLLKSANFGVLGLHERPDIQAAIRDSIGAITPGTKTMVLAEEFNSWDKASRRRIDLLCLDSDRNPVVVELKRDASVHMDLQAIRYAAMVSTMLWAHAVEAHRTFLTERRSNADPEQAIRKFLNVEDDEVVVFNDKVRIVLASADFSPELTTSVLWLNEKYAMDIRCVQMLPYAIEGKAKEKVFLDIQQVIPLPQAQQYTVSVREKTVDQEKVRIAASRKTLIYNITIGESVTLNLARADFLLALVREAIRQSVTPEQIMAGIRWKRPKVFLTLPGKADAEAFKAKYEDASEYFLSEQDRFVVAGNTYVFHALWGSKTSQAADIIKALMPDHSAVSWEAADPSSAEPLLQDEVGPKNRISRARLSRPR